MQRRAYRAAATAPAPAGSRARRRTGLFRAAGIARQGMGFGGKLLLWIRDAGRRRRGGGGEGEVRGGGARRSRRAHLDEGFGLSRDSAESAVQLLLLLHQTPLPSAVHQPIICPRPAHRTRTRVLLLTLLATLRRRQINGRNGDRICILQRWLRRRHRGSASSPCCTLFPRRTNKSSEINSRR